MSTSKFCLVTESVHCCLDQAPEYQNELRIITIVHHAMVANCYAYRINQKFGFNQVFKCWQKADSMSVALSIRNATFQVCFWIKGNCHLASLSHSLQITHILCSIIIRGCQTFILVTTMDYGPLNSMWKIWIYLIFSLTIPMWYSI